VAQCIFAQIDIRITLNHGKKPPKTSGYCCIKKKTAQKKTIAPIGENSPNLVTLLLFQTSIFFPSVASGAGLPDFS
jgi:hypothetical protein